MKTVKNIEIKSSKHQKPIVTDLFYNSNNCKKPLIIFCHGFKGYKDWGAWNLVAKQVAEKNLFFVKFNFSHNGGTVENPIDFFDLEAFSNNNFSLELQDLEDVLNSVLNNPSLVSEIDSKNITLIGHSRGGGIAVIKASENNLITKVVSWAGVSDFGAHFADKEGIKQWKKQGVTYIENSRTHQKMPLNYQFYEDFEENKARLTIKKAVEKLNIPQLIVQGSLDDIVKPKEAENLHNWNPKSKLVLIEGMNHSLDCTQPNLGKNLPTNLQKVVDITLQFILN